MGSGRGHATARHRAQTGRLGAPINRYSHHLAYLGRFEEAHRELETARRLDPLSLVLERDRGELLMFEGRIDEAVSALSALFEREPDFRSTGYYLAVAAAEAGHDESVINRSPPIDNIADFRMLPVLGRAHARQGRTDLARDALRRLDQLKSAARIPGISFAAIHAALGETQLALDALETELNDPSYQAAQIGVHPWFASLRDEPRFQAMLNRVGVAADPSH